MDKEARQAVKTRCERIISALKALYDEMDKLNRKSPLMTVSPMALEQVNKIIIASKEAVGAFDDEFMSDLVPFVPAGDEIEVRDVVLVLGQLRAGLRRFVDSHEDIWQEYDPIKNPGHI